jgi:long-chain acyl-CoA synthetase
MTRIAQLLEQLTHYGSFQCIDGCGGAWTYHELLQATQQWHARFCSWSVDAGTVIGLVADYSLPSVSAILALIARQAVVALIPNDPNIDRYLVDSHAAALLVVGMDDKYTWDHLPRQPPHPLLERLSASGEGGIVVFTSGSMGHAKAVLHSAERFLCKFQHPGRRLRTLAFMVFDHIAGLDTTFYTLSKGGTLILPHRRDPTAVLETIATYKVEVLPASPSFLRLFTVMPHRELPSLKIITYGAELMDVYTLSRLNSMFPNVRILQKYGTSETGSPQSESEGNDSLWMRFTDHAVETKVIDGVLWLRGESASLGYLNASSPFDSRGWYCTHDRVDVEDNWIRFRGRECELINVGGEKVSPIEVEQCIRSLDFVVDVIVSAQPHELMGDVVSARILLTVTEKDRKAAVRRIREHCRSHLPAYKVPVQIIIETEGLLTYRKKQRRMRSR